MIVTPMSFNNQDRQHQEEDDEYSSRNNEQDIPRPAPQPPAPMMMMPPMSRIMMTPAVQAQQNNTTVTTTTNNNNNSSSTSTNTYGITTSTTSTTAAAAMHPTTSFRNSNHDKNHRYSAPPAATVIPSSSSVVSSDTSTCWTIGVPPPQPQHEHEQGTRTLSTCPWQQEAHRLRVLLKDLGFSSLLSSSTRVPPSSVLVSSSSGHSCCHNDHHYHHHHGDPNTEHWHSLLLDEYQSLQECNQNLQSQLEAQVQYHEQMHQDLLLQQAKQHGEYQNAMTHLRQELEQKRQEIVDLTRGQKEMEGILKDMEHQMDWMSDEKYQWMQEVENCKRQNVNHHEKILELQMISARYHDDCQELEQRVQDLMEERDRYEIMWREERDRGRGLEEDLGRLRLNLEKTEINVCKLVREKAHLVTRLNEANARLERKKVVVVKRQVGDERGGGMKRVVMNHESVVGMQLQERQRQVEHSLQQLEEMSKLRRNDHDDIHGGDPQLSTACARDRVTSVLEERKQFDTIAVTSSSSNGIPLKLAKTMNLEQEEYNNNNNNNNNMQTINNNENGDPQKSQCSLQELDIDSLLFLEPLSLHDGHGEKVESEMDEKKLNPPSLQKASRTLFDFIPAAGDDSVSRSLF
jgi:hypothetical protein